MTDKEKSLNRITDFINARYITINGEKYLPVDNNTARHLLRDIYMSDEDYTDNDDFRSRA